MKNDVDIGLAMSLEDLTLLDCSFHAAASLKGRTLERQLYVGNPEKRFSLDVKRRRNVLQATVNIQFGLVDHFDEREQGDLEVMHFGIVGGAVISAPIMGDTAIAPKHLAGPIEPKNHRDQAMERSMRMEAIKAVYGMAIGRLAEFSSMSPVGLITLPLIDSDEMLDDIVNQERGPNE